MSKLALAALWGMGCGSDAEPAAEPPDLEACLASMEDAQPAAEVWYSGATLQLRDGAQVGYDYAPQGGLFTPFFVRLWGAPELWGSQPEEGRAWVRWSVVDPVDGYVLFEADRGQRVDCVSAEADSHLELELHVQYFGEDGTTFVGMRPEELQDREVTLRIELGQHPAPSGEETQWGGTVYTDDPVDFTTQFMFDVVLSDSVAL